MNRDSLKYIIEDQKSSYLNNPLIPRSVQLEANVNYCFVGIRRTGKSYMMFQQIRELLNRGVPLSQIMYVNFEDERLVEMGTEDLNTILEIGLELSGAEAVPYLFFDEIQNVPGWEKFARRLADAKYHVNITGSNSKMLSREIASTLGGRFISVQIFPYTFGEYLAAKGQEQKEIISTKDRAKIAALYYEYVTYGAFPELVNIKNKRMLLSTIYQTLYLGDIIARNNISNNFAIKLILKKIAESITKPLSFTRLTNILKSTGAKISTQTAINYVDAITDSYMLFTLQNYAAKLVDKETAPKYYFMDTGLLGLLAIHCESAQLENLVAIELVRRYGQDNVFFFENNVEIDFYVPARNLAIQVSLRALDDFDTRERETGAFVKFRKFMPEAECLLITNSEEAELDCAGVPIHVLPAWKWLLFEADPAIGTSSAEGQY